MGLQSFPIARVPSIARFTAWVVLAAILLATFVPPALRPVTAVPHTLEHFVIFALVGGAFCVGYPERVFGIAVTALPSIAVLELLQLLDPGRHARLGDFAINAIGAYVGMALACLVARATRRLLTLG